MKKIVIPAVSVFIFLSFSALAGAQFYDPYNPYMQQQPDPYQYNPYQYSQQYGQYDQYSQNYNYQFTQTQATPGVDLQTRSTSIFRGDSVTLSWQSNNADNCIATGGSGGWARSQPVTGSQTLMPGATANYTLTCTNVTGGSASDTVTVTVMDPPPVTADIKANGADGPITLPFGSPATISWISRNATNCRVMPANFMGTTGSQSSQPLNTTTTFSLDCSNGRGSSAQDSVTVNISPLQPTVTLSVSPFIQNQTSQFNSQNYMYQNPYQQNFQPQIPAQQNFQSFPQSFPSYTQNYPAYSPAYNMNQLNPNQFVNPNQLPNQIANPNQLNPQIIQPQTDPSSSLAAARMASIQRYQELIATNQMLNTRTCVNPYTGTTYSSASPCPTVSQQPQMMQQPNFITQ